MFVYYGKRFDAAQAGGRIIGLHCEKCGCKYHYELARIGTGSGTAHYGIGASSATQASEQGSARDLQRRLALEAELVPCPTCNWISGELVSGYRRGRFRGLGALAFLVGLLGTVISLLCAWFISSGPPGDRGVLPYLLYGGPALSLSLAAAILLLRFGLRRLLIRPNRDFPRPPRLPPGTPPALLLDEGSDELRIAIPQPANDDGVNDWHDIQIGRHHLPLVCCNCLRPATKERAVIVALGVMESPIKLEIPQCAACASESANRYYRWPIFVVIGLFVAAGAAAPFVFEAQAASCVIFTLLAALFAVVGIMAKMLTPTSPVVVLAVDRSRGVVRLRFRNPGYGRLIGKYLSGMSAGEAQPERAEQPGSNAIAPGSPPSPEKRGRGID